MRVGEKGKGRRTYTFMSLSDIHAQMTNVPGSLEGREPLIPLVRLKTE